MIKPSRSAVVRSVRHSRLRHHVIHQSWKLSTTITLSLCGNAVQPIGRVISLGDYEVPKWPHKAPAILRDEIAMLMVLGRHNGAGVPLAPFKQQWSCLLQEQEGHEAGR